MTGKTPCSHHWIRAEGNCDTCGGHDYLFCDICDDTVDCYGSAKEADRFEEIVTSGNFVDQV